MKYLLGFVVGVALSFSCLHCPVLRLHLAPVLPSACKCDKAVCKCSNDCWCTDCKCASADMKCNAQCNCAK